MIVPPSVFFITHISWSDVQPLKAYLKKCSLRKGLLYRERGYSCR